MENLKTSSDVLFILIGATMVLAMHAGFAFFGTGHRSAQKPSQRSSENFGGFLYVHHRVLFHWLYRCLRR